MHQAVCPHKGRLPWEASILTRQRKGGREKTSLKKRSPIPRGRGRRISSPRASRPALPFANEVIGILYQQEGWTEDTEIIAALALARTRKKELQQILGALCHQGVLACKGSRYRLAASLEVMEGTIAAHPRGFAFAKITKAPAGREFKRDLFIPPENLGTARHGDRVLLVIAGQERDRLLGRVIQVLDRGRSQLVGTYTAGSRTGLVIPEDDRYPFTIVVPRTAALGARDGEAVLVEITDQPAAGHPEGKIAEVLGDPNKIAVQTEMVIRKFDLPHRFGAEALAQADGLDARVDAADKRADLRQIPHVTIDGETARDFDDAVAVEEQAKGWRLYVSIADVSHYVRLGTPLDQEAYQRGTSVYFPDRVLPMLPERLSNDLCSLVPDQDRLAFTAILDFTRDGRPAGKKFCKSVIRSHHRFTYTTVNQIVTDHDPEVCREHQTFLPMLEAMEKLARQLLARRMARGSIGFEIPEAKVIIGEAETVAGILRVERNFAQQIIEEFMLAANEAVAETFAEKEFPALYRIHETPDPIKVAEFGEFAASLGLELPPDPGSPRWFGKVLKLVAGRPTEYIIHNLLLRTMKQAAYAPENVGHFGLAAPYYTHFTSPIRRYPDLMVHRALDQLLGGTPGAKAKSVSQPLPDAGVFLSARERVAVDADREMVDRLKTRFMATKLGEEFQGVISGVAQFGLFVELLDLYVSGAISVADLHDDYFQLEEKRHRYLGQRTGQILQMGDLVRVRVTNVNLRRRRVDFELLEKL
jgi:ribonuclease R